MKEVIELFCTKCGAAHDPNYPFCTECGAPFTVPKKKKGSLWPPLIFILFMLVIGIAVYLTYPEDTVLSKTPWFTTQNGGIIFDATLYNGSEEVTVPEGVSALTDRCFYDCDELTTVHLPDSLTRVGERAFADCDALRGIKLPEGLTEIGACAFESCDALEALAIPDSVAAIGSNAFKNCPALRHIFFEGTKSQWNSLFQEKIGQEITVFCIDGSISGSNQKP